MDTGVGQDWKGGLNGVEGVRLPWRGGGRVPWMRVHVPRSKDIWKWVGIGVRVGVRVRIRLRIGLV